MIEETLRNLVDTIAKMQKNQENEKKEKMTLQIGENSQAARKLPLKLEVKFKLKSFGGEMDPEWLNQWFKQIP